MQKLFILSLLFYFCFVTAYCADAFVPEPYLTPPAAFTALTAEDIPPFFITKNKKEEEKKKS